MSDNPVKETEKKSNLPPGPGPGRPKGLPNKYTNLKNAFLEVFERLGGIDGLEAWANDSKLNQRLYYQWITKMLPSSVVGGQDEKGEFHPLTVIIGTNGNKPPDNPTSIPG